MEAEQDKKYVFGGLLRFFQQRHDHNLPRKVILRLTTKLLSKDIDKTFD